MTIAQKRERILPRLIEEEMRDSFLDYSMSVIVQRALPDVRDGLKPVHRRILFAMHELRLTPDRPYKKSATVVGDVLGKYHPHGDSAVYDALVRMVQSFSLRYPLIDGQGNFGSIDGDSAAAYRYTEARLAPPALELLADIDRETVDFVANFDSRLDEPSVLPARIPNLLVNGSSGIAVGMSTNVPPHNLGEIAAAVHHLVQNPECSIDDVMALVKGPDFPTAGFIVGTDGIENMYRNGRGRVVMRARVIKEGLRGGRNQLVVTELPYAVSKSKIISQIADLARKGKLDDVSDIRDESDRDGLRFVVELKRGADATQVLRTLYRKTYLQATFGAIMLALDDGAPREFNLKELLERFRDHRLDVIVRRARRDLENAQAERHVVEGLLAALDHIDEVIKIIRRSQDRPQASERLQSRFGLSEIQADSILNMRLGKLTALEGEQLRAQLAELKVVIRGLRGILGSHERQLEILLEELDEVVEKLADDRRTVILADEEEDSASIEDTVADEDVVVTLTHQGYVKRIPVHLYRRRISGGKGLVGMDRYEDDYLERVFTARTKGWILGFTDTGHAHFLPVLDVPEGSRASRGQSVYGLLGLDRSGSIVAMVPVEDLTAERFLVFLTRRGIIKRTRLDEFSNPRSAGVIAIGVKKDDDVMDVGLSDGSAEVLLLTREGRAIRFAEEDVSLLGRNAQGVKGIGLQGDDAVVGMLVVRRDAAVFTVTDRGMGKRTELSDFPLQKRGGMGTMAIPGSEEVGVLVGALEVQPGDDVMLVAAGGTVTKLAADEIPVQGRRTHGAQLVRLAGGDRLVEVTRGHAGSASSVGSEGPSAAAEATEHEDSTADQMDLLGEDQPED